MQNTSGFSWTMWRAAMTSWALLSTSCPARPHRSRSSHREPAASPSSFWISRSKATESSGFSWAAARTAVDTATEAPAASKTARKSAARACARSESDARVGGKGAEEVGSERSFVFGKLCCSSASKTPRIPRRRRVDPPHTRNGGQPASPPPLEAIRRRGVVRARTVPQSSAPPRASLDTASQEQKLT
ncbi:hypothetical protein DFJ74DRAFT_518462 [Hyaloraphidium curvatum]|nr:hypothetical protein DFJ74DRAFT_518462 [Hyaloraphidium curvatum]